MSRKRAVGIRKVGGAPYKAACAARLQPARRLNHIGSKCAPYKTAFFTTADRQNLNARHDRAKITEKEES
jgi:hypothetical protein